MNSIPPVSNRTPAPPATRPAQERAWTPQDGVLLSGSQAPTDLRTAMRAVENASDPPPADAEELWSTRASHFVFRTFTSPTGTVIEAGNDGHFLVYGADGALVRSQTLTAEHRSLKPAFRPDGGFFMADDQGVVPYSPSGEPGERLALAGVTGMATAADGSLYVETPMALKAFSPAGEPLWSHDRTFPGRSTEPVVLPGGGVVVVEGDDSILALNADGTERWRNTDLRAGRYGPGAVAALVDRPVAAPDGSVVLATREGQVRHLGPDGKLQWEAPARGLQRVVVDGQGAVYARADKEVLGWSPAGATTFRRAVGNLYGMSAVPAGGVALATDQGLLGLEPSGRQWFRVPAEPARYLTEPSFAPDGTMRSGGAQEVRAFRLPAPSASPSTVAERALQAARAAEDVAPQVVESDAWVDIGGIRLAVRPEA